MSRKHVIQDRTLELTLGVALFIAGAYLIRDSYEGRNRKRPFIAGLALP